MMRTLAETMVDQMATQGMGGDRDAMLQILRHVSCYRIHCYAMHFIKDRDSDRPRYDCFFEDVTRLYQADRALRRNIFTALDPIEVSIRASWSGHIETNYGPKGHLKSEIYKTLKSKEARKIRSRQDELLETHRKLCPKCSQQRRTFLDELLEKLVEMNCSDLEIQPLSEEISFGALSRFVGALKESKVRQICPELDFGDRLGPILHHLTIVRNRCAHHWRVWDFCPPSIAKLKNRELTRSLHHDTTRKGNGRTRIYNTLTLLAYMLKIIEPDLWRHWHDDLFDLMDSEPFSDLAAAMGFPENWKKREVWNTPRQRECVTAAVASNRSPFSAQGG